jgi:MFS family permease
MAGAGAALVLPGTLATLSAVLPDEQRGRAVALWAAGVMIGGALGLLTTGAAIQAGSWRTSFLVMAGLGVLALLATARCVPETFDPEHATVDPPGAGFAFLAIGGLVLGIVELPSRSIHDPLVIGGLLVGLVGLAGFVWWELRARRPLLDLRLFARPSFAIGTVALVIVYGVAFGWYFLSFQYSSLVLGYSPLLAGVCLLPTAFSVIPLAMTSPRLARARGRGRIIAAGLVVMAGGAVVLIAVSSAQEVVPLAAGYIVFGAGIGLSCTPPTEAIIEALPAAEQGVASAVNDAAREIGAALGIAVLGSLFDQGYRSRVEHLLARAPAALRAAATHGTTAGLNHTEAAQATEVVRHGVIAGWQLAFAGSAVALLLGALLVHVWSRRADRAPAAAPRPLGWDGLEEALRFARRTDGALALVRFAEGQDRWMVFHAERPVAAFPPLPGELPEALDGHERSPLLSVDQLDAALGALLTSIGADG